MRFRAWMLWTFAVLALFIIVARVSASPVGCEPYNSSVVKCWNQGSIENTTYVSDNMVDISNSPDRFGWADYEDCLVRHNRNTNETAYYCVGDVGQGSFFTDNLTFWKAEYNQSVPSGFFGKKFEQDTFDDYVNRTIYWKRSGAIPPFIDLWLGFCIKDINISLNDNVDVINWEADGQLAGPLVNDSDYYPYATFNLTGGVTVGDMVSDEGIVWRPDWSRRNGFSWDGSRACVMEKINIGNGQSSFEWIDVDLCLMGVSGRPTIAGCTLYNKTASTMFTRNYTAFGHYDILCFGTCSISFNNFCFGVGIENTTGTEFIMEGQPLANPYKKPVCADYTSPKCNQDEISNYFYPGDYWLGSTRNFTITCLTVGIKYLHLNMSNGANGWYDCQGARLYNCPADNKVPYVNITTANNSEYDAGSHYASAYATDQAKDALYPLTNMSLFSNQSGVYKLDYWVSVWQNESVTKEFQINITSGDVIFSVTACDNNGLCNSSTNSTFRWVRAVRMNIPRLWIFGRLFGGWF